MFGRSDLNSGYHILQNIVILYNIFITNKSEISFFSWLSWKYNSVIEFENRLEKGIISLFEKEYLLNQNGLGISIFSNIIKELLANVSGIMFQLTIYALFSLS